MRAFVQDQILQVVNVSERSLNANGSDFTLNETVFGIIHPHWWDVPALPLEAHQFLGALGVLVYLFAFSGNVAVLQLIIR